ncbi:hypothetical protein [Allorhodopirellula solitaria]|nr:hypothetical protein [Allorhodopirellula solitaria]
MARCFLLVILANPAAFGSDDFVWPGNGVPVDRPVWGHRDGLRIGLAPAPGPHGLIRIYTPYLGQAYPRMVNFLSVEPSVVGQPGRGQSELEQSRLHPGQGGLTFVPSNSESSGEPAAMLPTGVHDPDTETLALFVHTEPFRNVAHPILKLVFHCDQPHAVQIVIFTAADSATMTSCVLSATMGNYGLLRELHLADHQVEQAAELWADEPLDRLDFLPWRVWPAKELEQTGGGGYRVSLTSDLAHPEDADYSSAVPANWRYEGQAARHFWRTEAGVQPEVAVNARQTYWATDAPIPGGACFENFELRIPFRNAQRLWFGVEPIGRGDRPEAAPQPPR